jgi:hypothetical protein
VPAPQAMIVPSAQLEEHTAPEAAAEAGWIAIE